MRGHIRKKLYGNREIVVQWECRSTRWLGAQMGSVLKPIQTLKEYFVCHLIALTLVPLGTTWYQIVGASRTVSQRQSLYPPEGHVNGTAFCGCTCAGLSKWRDEPVDYLSSERCIFCITQSQRLYDFWFYSSKHPIAHLRNSLASEDPKTPHPHRDPSPHFVRVPLGFESSKCLCACESLRTWMSCSAVLEGI